MTKYILSFLLVFSLSSLTFNMEVKKDKVKFKKGIIYINSNEYSKYEKKANKYFLKTIEDKDFVSINFLSFGSGKYDQNGKEIPKFYQEINFYNDSIGTFEVQLSKKNIIRYLNDENVLLEGKINWENVRKFKIKYSEKISERRFLTK